MPTYNEKTITTYLDSHRIAYQRWDHPAVFTVEQVDRLALDLPGIHTKNLFLRDKRATRLVLLVVRGDKNIQLKEAAEKIGVNNLSFASAERLQNNLGISAGSVSVLALVNDVDHRVEVVFDREVWQAEAVTAHPLINTSTLVISHADLEKLLALTGHSAQIIDLP